jgi:hypothetical protein
MRVALLISWIVLRSVMCVVPAHAETRVALVIGNSAYQHVPALANPVRDATDIAVSLERLGFLVHKVTDANRNGMRRALVDFAPEAKRADIAVVYFAGHGIAIGGKNWLIPVDAQINRDIDAQFEAISLWDLISIVGAASDLGLIILDAAREYPYSAQRQRITARKGLTPVQPTGHVLVAYAAKDGATASDGVGRNSPFTAALLRNIEVPGLEIDSMLRTVRDEVLRATNRRQEPVTYGMGSERGLFLARTPTAPRPPVSIGVDAPARASTDACGFSLLCSLPEPQPVPRPPRAEAQLPQFPWPPPAASALYVMPPELLVGRAAKAKGTLSDVADKITGALEGAAYFERSFYSVPNGFAMVTRLERIRQDGSPDAFRWVDVDTEQNFSLARYLRGLLFSDPGHFRLIVFVVTDRPFSATGAPLGIAESKTLLSQGFNTIPRSTSAITVSADHQCSVLIYEFEKEKDRKPKFVAHSAIPARQHLEKAMVWSAFAGAL